MVRGISKQFQKGSGFARDFTALLRSQQGQRWQTKQFYDNGIGYKLI
jgi:hypothetical protein